MGTAKWIFRRREKLVLTDKAAVKEGAFLLPESQRAFVLKKRRVFWVPVCSACGERGDDWYDATPFCPMCGRKMINPEVKQEAGKWQR